MKPSRYREQWRAWRERPEPATLSRLARGIAGSFVDHHYQNGEYVRDYIDLLCEMATAFPEAERNAVAAGALFGVIVEELCDDYEDFQWETYNRVMSQVISYCRALPAGRSLDACLSRFGLRTEEAIYRRAKRIHTARPVLKTDRPIKKVLVLSRVTIGADVAIVSVIVQRLQRCFPEAQIVLAGPGKLRQLFGGNRGIRFGEVSYGRRGGLWERLGSWFEVGAILARESQDCGPGGLICVDSDSRLLQLGLLPLDLEDTDYFYFNSHRNDPGTETARMAELTNHWLDEVTGRKDFAYPCLWLSPDEGRVGRDVVEALRAGGARRAVTVNFGVGGNPRKRLGPVFEKKLVADLLDEPGTVVILDRGFGPEEREAAGEILDFVRERGRAVQELRCGDEGAVGLSGGVLGVEAGIGDMAGLIGASDEFIGYDSACQHLAAAQEVPTLTIFAGTNHPRFIRRWSACGKSPNQIVHVNTLSDPGHIEVDEVIERIRQERAGREEVVSPSGTRVADYGLRSRRTGRPIKSKRS